MYYTNKGVQALVDLDYDKAYTYFKEAIKKDPSFSYCWGNLGILYRLTDNTHLAISTYRHSQSLNKNNLTTMHNLSILLRLKGSTEEVQLIEQLLQH